MGGLVAWVTWIAYLREWCASVRSVGGLGGVSSWVACYYYCYY